MITSLYAVLSQPSDTLDFERTRRKTRAPLVLDNVIRELGNIDHNMPSKRVILDEMIKLRGQHRLEEVRPI